MIRCGYGIGGRASRKYAIHTRNPDFPNLKFQTFGVVNLNQQRETRETAETLSPRLQVNSVSELSLEPKVSNFIVCESESAAGDTVLFSFHGVGYILVGYRDVWAQVNRVLSLIHIQEARQARCPCIQFCVQVKPMRTACPSDTDIQSTGTCLSVR